MLEYKTERYGCESIVVPHFHPSAKTCSACGHVKDEMLLAERIFRCEVDAPEIDRDRNTAGNLAALVAGSALETQNACGAAGCGPGERPRETGCGEAGSS